MQDQELTFVEDSLSFEDEVERQTFVLVGAEEAVSLLELDPRLVGNL